MFLDCPAYLGPGDAARCGLPAEVRCRFTMRSTDGPVECAMIRCPAGHWFNGSIESLILPSTGQCGRDRRGGRGGSAVSAFPAEPERDVPRPNSAPAYYLGRSARVWITVMRPRHRHTASQHPAGAIVVKHR